MRTSRPLLAFSAACLLLIATFTLTNIVLDARLLPAKQPKSSFSDSQILLSDAEDPETPLPEWEKDFSRYGLNAIQCSSEFKSLFFEIERAVAHRKKIGNVTESGIDVDWKDRGAVRAMIYNQRVTSPEAL